MKDDYDGPGFDARDRKLKELREKYIREWQKNGPKYWATGEDKPLKKKRKTTKKTTKKGVKGGKLF